MTIKRPLPALPAMAVALVIAALSPAGAVRGASPSTGASTEGSGLIEDPSRPDGFYCGERKLGSWFYCSKPKPRQKGEASRSVPSQTAAERLDAVTAQLRELKARAILEPTTENVQSYIRFQREQLDRSSLFADVWQRAVWQDPNLDYTQLRPISTLGKRQWLDDRKADRDAALVRLGQRYGLFYFFAQSCAPCSIMSPILKSVADSHQIAVKAISTDGGPSDVFPRYVVDSGQRERMGLDSRVTPAIVLFDSVTNKAVPIGYGVMAADELMDRIYTLTQTEPGRDY
jgi:conjugal transfer pilus assembly protein TraF